MAEIKLQDSFSNLELADMPKDLDWLQKAKGSAFDEFQKLKFPNRKWEGWKYIDLDPVLNLPYILSRKKNVPEYQPELLTQHFIEECYSSRLVFINGIFSEEFSSVLDLPQGVILKQLSGGLIEHAPALKEKLIKSLSRKSHPFVSINNFSFEDGAVLYVPGNVILDKPIELMFAGVGEEGKSFVSHPRILIVMEEGAQAEVIVHQEGISEGDYFLNTVCDVFLEKESKLSLDLIQNEKNKANHFMTVQARLGEKSRLDGISFVHGGAVRREEIEIILEGSRASSYIKSLGFLSQDSKAYQHVACHHQSKGGISRQIYKNILADKAQAEFNSLVYVAREGEKTDSNQMNRNLLLSDSARAFSRPQLKIDADDVQCTHGSATGQLEEEELFYLESRGLNRTLAQHVLAYGFAEEILAEIRSPSLKRDLECDVRLELGKILESKTSGRKQHNERE